MGGKEDKPTRPMGLDEAVRREIQRRIDEMDEAERVKQTRPEERERGERSRDPTESRNPESRPED